MSINSIAGSTRQPWIWQVTALSFVLGLLLAGSLQTVSSIRRLGGGPRRVGVPPSPGQSVNTTLRQRDQEIGELRAQKTKLENTLSKQGGAATALNEELQKVKRLADLTEVQGPGIILWLQDSKSGPPSNRSYEADNYIIHDVTIQRALNELNASGAEAISINGQRVTGRTAIRCVGPTAQVNGVPLASPYEIRVIGDPSALAGGLTLREGFIDYLRSFDVSMARIEKKTKLTIPAYTGSTEYRWAKSVIREDNSSRSDAGTKE